MTKPGFYATATETYAVTDQGNVYLVDGIDMDRPTAYLRERLPAAARPQPLMGCESEPYLELLAPETIA